MNDISGDVIRKEMIFLQSKLTKKEDILEFLVDKSKENDLITKKAPFFEAIMNRESEVPTAIGYKIAIPHGKSSVVNTPFISFLQTESEFLWTEDYEESVKLVFLIGVPAENSNNIHLKFISQLSKKLLDDTFRENLIQVKNQNEAYEILSSI